MTANKDYYLKGLTRFLKGFARLVQGLGMTFEALVRPLKTLMELF